MFRDGCVTMLLQEVLQANAFALEQREREHVARLQEAFILCRLYQRGHLVIFYVVRKSGQAETVFRRSFRLVAPDDLSPVSIGPAKGHKRQGKQGDEQKKLQQVELCSFGL